MTVVTPQCPTVRSQFDHSLASNSLGGRGAAQATEVVRLTPNQQREAVDPAVRLASRKVVLLPGLGHDDTLGDRSARGEAGTSLLFWFDGPDGWAAESRRHIYPDPEQRVSREVRVVEFEIRAPASAAPDRTEIPGYALYYVCEDVRGTCLYRRQDIRTPIEIGPPEQPARQEEFSPLVRWSRFVFLTDSRRGIINCRAPGPPESVPGWQYRQMRRRGAMCPEG